MQWRLIPFEEQDGPTAMATDEAILDSVIHGDSRPTLRFYTWKPTVSIGYFQTIRDIDVDYCKKNTIQCVRRITGGGALLHSNGELAYCIVAPKKVLSLPLLSVTQTYSVVCQAIINAFAELGICGEIKHTNDVFIGHKKISAHAQVQREGVILQHGNILFKPFNLELLRILPKFKTMDITLSKNQISNSITSVSEQCSVSQHDFYAVVSSPFMKDKEVILQPLTHDEQNRIEHLRKKYVSAAWLQGRGTEKSRGACYFGHIPFLSKTKRA